MLFKDYKECESVVKLISTQLTSDSIKELEMTKDISKYMTDKEKSYRLINTLKHRLWDIPEAIETGFHKYIRIKTKEYTDLLNYHSKHCPKENCKVCEVLK
jgi:hypothetical protein